MAERRGYLRHALFVLALLAAAAISAALVSAAARRHAATQQPVQPEKPAARVTRPGTPVADAAAVLAEIDRLAEEQQFAASAERAEALLERAQAAGDAETWTRSLIKAVQMRTALGGFETAVDFLRAEPWPPRPEDALHRALLNLFYGQSLAHYQRAYAWEIRQRQRVASEGGALPPQLKAWTAEEIAAEAERAYFSAWELRQRLGEIPVSRWSEFVDPNTYPEEVRGTLRDSVSYLFVKLLAEQSLWSPRESNEVHRLDLEPLLAEDGALAAIAHDAAAHPLQRLAAVLADLGAWHRGRRARAAQLEARLVRARLLHEALTLEEDRTRIRRDLEERLPAFRQIPWWAAGKFTLADLTREQDDPQALVRARALAEEGRRAYPDTPGGQLALRLVREIEAPEFELQAMSSDGLDRRSLALDHKNLAAVFFRAFRIDLADRVGAAHRHGLWPQDEELRRMVRARRPDAAWREALPETPDYRMHRTYVTPPLDRPGAYLVVASARDDFAEDGNKMLGVNLFVGDLVLLGRGQEGGAVDVLVRNGEMGTPAPGVELRLYRHDWERGPRQVRRASSDARGAARFQLDPRQNHFVLALRGGEAAQLEVGQAFTQPDAVRTALVYTDRSIYRPGQKIAWKVLAFGGRRDRGTLTPLERAPITLRLHDPNDQQVATAMVATNAFGTAAGEFTIPAGRPLGAWSIQTSLDSSSTIRVEEYKRPTFEVTILDPETPLRLNREATLVGEARYYFGLPVTEGQVSWQVVREPLFPWWWHAWGWIPERGQTQTIAGGTAELDAQGRFRLTFTPLADERLGKDESGLTYRYRLTAAATDEGGETREAERAFRLGFVAVEATIRSEENFLRAGETGSVVITRTNLDGVPRPGQGAWRIFELEQPAEARLPSEEPLPEAPAGKQGFETRGDRLRPRWERGMETRQVMRLWQEGREAAAGGAEHDAKGQATVRLPALPGGAYRLRYTTRDEFGAEAEASHDFLVAGAPGRLELAAVLEVEKDRYRPGETARLLVHSGFAGQDLVFEIYRRGRLVERRAVAAGEGPNVVPLPIAEEDRGGLGVRLTALRDHQMVELSRSVNVPWTNKELEVEFATFRDRLRPGTKESFQVKVRGAENAEAVAAELLAYMYDRSLDYFAPHHPANPLAFLPQGAALPWPQASLGQAHGQWLAGGEWHPLPPSPNLSPDRLRFFDRWGVGGPGERLQALGMVGGVPGGVVGGVATPAPQAAARAEDRAVSSKDARIVNAAEPAGRFAMAEPAPVELRADFSETAFFTPHLLTGADGSAAIEFEVPDSVTSWSFWVHALTEDLRYGSAQRETRSVKDLMVRPYLPRFLREGDQAELRVVVNNASEKPLSGEVRLEVLSLDDERDLAADFGLPPGPASRRFTVEPGGGSTVTFPLTAPRRVGQAAFKVTARAGDFSDGELRPLPILPARVHLAQSRFAALRGADRRVLEFADLERADPTRINDQMVVTIDAQLFYSVLRALPYLVNYPYECTEQTLNRFLSTGIVGSLFDQYPAVARMAAELAKRETRFETWDPRDPNRKMALEETPWLRVARGGKEEDDELINVLDPKIVGAQRDAALAKLVEDQLPTGAFPWFPGGPPSDFMTLYILYGFAKAGEFEVEVPREVVQRGWGYLAARYRDEWAKEVGKKDGCCVEFLTFLNYVASAYPDPSWMGDALPVEERRRILDWSFEHWTKHSPYLKGLLALTLHRMDRPQDAQRVFASVMDSAKTTRDEGTFWVPEDRSWLWYNDTIESHAFALRTLLEIAPQDPRRDGLVQWLFLNKKLSHWKSTRATAEVLYALVHYLDREKQLGAREAATVRVGGRTTDFVFEPDRYTGRSNQIAIPGEQLDASTAKVEVEKETPGILFASATWHFSTEELPAQGSGDLFAVERRYFRRVPRGEETVLEPLVDSKGGTALAPGDEIEVQLSLRSRAQAEYVHLRDPRPAGLEPGRVTSGYRWDLGLAFYEETRDSGANFFIEWLPAGEYTLKYRLRANLAGTFRAGPATLQSMYAPEFTAYSAGHVVRVAGDAPKS